MTNLEFVSTIINNLKHLTKDEHISRRFILEVGKTEATNLISQKLLEKTIFREDNLFKTIRCLEMIPQDVVRCGIYEFQRCKSVMRSKKKLPKLLYSRYGNSIIEVTSVDSNILFLPITLTDYKLLDKRFRRKNAKKNSYYYVQDGYLYLPDSEIEYVDVTLITLEDKCVSDLSTCGAAEESTCKSLWNCEFTCPDKLMSTVIAQTIQKVAMGRQIPTDELPNLDSNQKTGQKL